MKPAREQGSTMAWTVIFLAVVVVPLMSLVIDGARLFYVRGRLQTAAEAACEDAAWSAADRIRFRETGTTTFQDAWYHVGLAQNTFNQTLGEQNQRQYAANVVVQMNPANARAQCAAQASVPLMTTFGLAFSPVVIHAQAVALIRFARP